MPDNLLTASDARAMLIVDNERLEQTMREIMNLIRESATHHTTVTYSQYCMTDTILRCVLEQLCLMGYDVGTDTREDVTTITIVW